MRSLLLFTLALVSSFTALAESPPTDEDLLRQLETLGKITQEAEQWANLEQTIARKRLNACNAAFGHAEFCNCLNSQLHWILDFDTYIRVITSPDAHPSPSPTTDEERAVNSVFQTRERCVSRLFK